MANYEQEIYVDGDFEVNSEFADKWDDLMDLEVTFREQRRALRDWCCFETAISHPHSILGGIEGPEDGPTRWLLSYSVEQSDKSIFIKLLTTACCMAGIPTVVVVCETLGSSKAVEGKMNGLAQAICAALPVSTDLGNTKFMDGVKKNWDNLAMDNYDGTLVVPGTYTPAVKRLTEYLTDKDYRPILIVDEGDKLFRSYFDIDEEPTQLNELQRSLKELFNCARAVNVVTATPQSYSNRHIRMGHLC